MDLIQQIFNTSFFYSVIRVTIPLLLPAIAALVTNRAGVPNIGLEGIMLTSAFFAVIGSAVTNSAFMGVIIAIITGVFMASFLAFFTLKLKTDVILGGIALNLFASNFTVFLLYIITGDKGTSASIPSKVVPNLEIPIIKDIPILGPIISNHNILVYLAIILILLIYILLNKTKLGRHIMAVGENESAAQSVGIKVNKIRYIAFVISGILCGVAGAFLSMGYVSWFSRDMTAGRGWIALAAEAMGKGNMIGTTLSSILFGFSSALSNLIQIFGIPTELVSIVPNLITVIALIVYSIKNLKKKRKLNETNNN